MCIRALTRSHEAEHKARTCLCACIDRSGSDPGVTIHLPCVDAAADILLRKMKTSVSESERKDQALEVISVSTITSTSIKF